MPIFKRQQQRSTTSFADLNFGLENVDKKAVIVCALYGGKSSGADYCIHIQAAMDEILFAYCKADPGVWMRP